MNDINILITIVVFGVLIFVHELGHFLTAKAAGMSVEEFAIGMGPAIFKKRRGGTLYSLRLLPIGGFVKLEGEDGGVTDQNSFSQKPALARFIVLFAGAFMNLLLALIISIGLAAAADAIPSNTIAGFSENSVSSETGLKIGDTIIKVNNKKINTAIDMVLMLSASNAEPMTITVNRNGQTAVLEGVVFPVIESGELKGYARDFFFSAAPKTPFNVIRYGVLQCFAYTRSIWQSLLDILTGRVGLSNLAGPVGTSDVIGEAAEAGIDSLMVLVLFLSVNLAIVNLLPFPALDGGRILLLGIEKIRRKPLPEKFENALNFIGFALLILLMLYVTFNDVVRKIIG